LAVVAISRPWCSRSLHDGPLMLKTMALCMSRSRMAAAMRSDVPEGGRIGLRVAEGLAGTVVDVLVVDEDRNAGHDAGYLQDDKSPPFPARPGRRGAIAASYRMAPRPCNLQSANEARDDTSQRGADWATARVRPGHTGTR